MRKLTIILLCAGLCACATAPRREAVAPSPTSDQVLAAQYRAKNSHGEISGAEASAIADAYHRDIGKQIADSSDGKSPSPSP